MSTDTIDTTHTLKLTRRFPAPRERVFAAFTTLDALKRWLGPSECGVVGGEFDFRVGGTYRLQMKTHMGDSELGGTWREIDPPARIVMTWQWLGSCKEGEDDPDGPVTVLTFEFIALGAETELRLTQTGFADADSQGRHEYGWTGSFDKLAALVTA